MQKLTERPRKPFNNTSATPVPYLNSKEIQAQLKKYPVPIPKPQKSVLQDLRLQMKHVQREAYNYTISGTSNGIIQEAALKQMASAFKVDQNMLTTSLI